VRTPPRVNWKGFLGAVLGIMAIVAGCMSLIFVGVWATTHTEAPLPSDETSLLFGTVVSAGLALVLGVGALRLLPRAPREGGRSGSLAEDWQRFRSLPPPDSLWHRFVRIVDFILWAPQLLLVVVAPFSMPTFGLHSAGLPWVIAVPSGLACGLLFWRVVRYGIRQFTQVTERNRQRQYGA